MGFQIGMDLVELMEMERSLEMHDDRFLDRVYTPAERDRARRHPRRLAAGFAAKEATMKALGRTDEAIGWRSVEVIGDGRSPSVVLRGDAARLARERGVVGLTLSVSCDGELAAALAIAEVAS